jgi:hypothetical protein
MTTPAIPPVPPAPKTRTILGISKNTIVGALSFLITTFTVLTALQVPVIFNTNANHVWAYISGGSTLGLALCRAWVGLLQGDSTH